MPEPIYTAAVVFQRDDGAILTARKRGTSRFMLVGGKPEPGESPRQAAVREASEEVNIVLDADAYEFLGMWQTAAANEAGRDVHGTVFRARKPLAASPTPAAEIEEVRWLEPHGALPDNLAPLLATRVLPALAWRQGISGLSDPASAPWDCGHLPVAQYGTPGPLRRRLTDAIVTGQKTATTSRYCDYEPGELPHVGTLEQLADEHGQLLGLVETMAVSVVALGQVTDEHARAEGEGFADAAAWRRAHEEFWGQGHLPDDELIVVERFTFHPAP
ncbi:MAG: ASCH domain-containing protein [Bowdeniella nasicola]|nr:ASCH domain-containing protein [Bowdeniella nasicola]